MTVMLILSIVSMMFTSVGLVFVLAVRGEMKDISAESDSLKNGLAKCAVSLAKIDERTKTHNEELADLRANVDFVNGQLTEKTSRDEEIKLQIQKWNEGLDNIMNYSLDTAKGGKR